MLRRLLALLQSPLFADADLAELAVVAENVVESTYAKGDHVAPCGERLPSLHLVLDGQIEMVSTPASIWTANQTLGLLEVLDGRALPAPAIATVETSTLELGASELFEILDDNWGLLSGLIRTLAARAMALDVRTPRVPRLVTSAASPLGLVDRMILLRDHLPLLAARMRPLTILAHAAREVIWAPGEVVASAGAPGHEVHVIVEGTVTTASRDGGEKCLLGPGTALGALEVLAGQPNEVTMTTSARTRAVTLDSTVIFDVLEDHAELGLAIVSSLAGRILDAGGQMEIGTTTESNSAPLPSIACITSWSVPTSIKR